MNTDGFFVDGFTLTGLGQLHRILHQLQLLSFPGAFLRDSFPALLVGDTSNIWVLNQE